MTTHSQTPTVPSTPTPRMALLKRQGMPIEQIEEADAFNDERLAARFPGCLDGALAIRERFRPNGDRLPRDIGGKLPGEGQLVVTIVKQAVIEVEGQRTLVEDLDDVRTEERLREVAVFMRSWAGQALFDWTVENWVAVIKIMKRAGSKGASEEIVRTLLEGEEEWSPALLLSWKLARREALGWLESPDYLVADIQAEIQSAIEESEREMRRSYATFAVLKEGTPEPSPVHIPGV